MELGITYESDNRLLGRKDIEFNIVQEGSTPSRNEIKAELCKKLNLDPDSVMIVRIDQSTGVRQAHGVAHAYPSNALMEKLEPEYLVNRMKGIKKNAAEAGKQEKPKEEKKEERPKAEKQKEPAQEKKEAKGEEKKPEGKKVDEKK